jgi:uncharacterized protein YuzE
MAKTIKEIDYDLENDILFISHGDKVKTSIDIGEFILDVNSNNLICGLEVMDASENLGIDKSTLGSIKNMKMSVTYKTNHVYVLLMITFKKEEKEVNVPIPLTLNLGHKTPKHDILLYN